MSRESAHIYMFSGAFSVSALTFDFTNDVFYDGDVDCPASRFDDDCYIDKRVLYTRDIWEFDRVDPGLTLDDEAQDASHVFREDRRRFSVKSIKIKGVLNAIHKSGPGPAPALLPEDINQSNDEYEPDSAY